MTKIFSTKFLAAAFFCLLVGIGHVYAQSTVTGGISGKVTDPQGAIVPNASVTVTNEGTNSVATVTANEDGVFRVNNLQPGTYTVEISSSGFASFRQEKIVVEVGRLTSLDIPLGLAGQTAIVEVTAEAPVINTTSQDFTTNINQTSINELPINGRRASNFVLLAPATVPDGTFGLISFRGISGLLNNSTVDGGDNNQAFQSEERGRTRIGYVISQSAIREFQVNTSNYSAEYGRSAGGVINTVTKSGTNEFHGDLFEYYRNNRFGARNPLAFQTILNNGVSTIVGIKPTDIRHQFGGTIGGPIVKDRLFFFFSYDQQKRNFPGLAVFSNLNYLNTVNRTLLLSRGLTTAQIDNSLSFISSLSGETPRRQDQKLFLPKIDWQVNDNNLFSVSYNRLRAESPAGLQTQATNTIARRSFGDDFVNVDSLNARLQSTISTNLLNEARFQYSRDNEFAYSQEPLPGEPTTASTVAGPRSPSVNLTGGLTFGTTANFERVKFPDETRLQFADTVTFVRGRHTFKFGGDYNRVTDDIQNLRSQTGSYIYSTINDFIIDYVNFSSPLASTTACATGTNRVGRCYNGTYLQGIGIPGLKFSTHEYNFFLQDDFRVTPRLTVNLGLRYEYQKLPEAVLPNSSTTAIPNDGRTLAEATSTLPDDKNNFGPRLGVAYDITGDGKTSVRAGVGIYYGRIINAQIYNALLNTGNPGGQGQFTVNNNVTTNCFPLVPTATQACAPIFPNVLPSNLPLNLSAIQFYAKDFQAPLITQYDLVLEREIAKNTVVSVAYLGSQGRQLPTFVDQNLRRLGTTTTYTVNGGPFDGQTFTLPQYGRQLTTFAQLTQIQSTVKSEYNALVFQFNRRFTDGLQVQSSYTLAKATDTNQNSSVFPVNNSPYDLFDRSYDAGPSNNDVRHKFVVSAVYAPTLYKGETTSIYNYLANGWSIAPIYTFYSGRPFSSFVSGTSLNGSNGDAFFPLAGRNSFRLPNVSNLDLRLSKRFRFTERYNLELLAEGFNVLNKTHVFQQQNLLYTRASGTNTLNYNNNFGVNNESSSSNYRERQIQFAARFQF
ncbi:MAG: TonB-dependent receptor plug [Acidobacteria bacterium]|jgi:outer membrane receptor protein involved in Fe transport|nr:TonB-dependent receptor plug [Acidobacteriota bacterium]